MKYFHRVLTILIAFILLQFALEQFFVIKKSPKTSQKTDTTGHSEASQYLLIVQLLAISAFLMFIEFRSKTFKRNFKILSYRAAKSLLIIFLGSFLAYSPHKRSNSLAISVIGIGGFMLLTSWI